MGSRKLSTAAGRSFVSGSARPGLHKLRCRGSALQQEVAGYEWVGKQPVRPWTQVKHNTRAGRLLSGANQLW